MPEIRCQLCPKTGQASVTEVFSRLTLKPAILLQVSFGNGSLLNTCGMLNFGCSTSFQLFRLSEYPLLRRIHMLLHSSVANTPTQAPYVLPNPFLSHREVARPVRRVHSIFADDMSPDDGKSWMSFSREGVRKTITSLSLFWQRSGDMTAS